MTNLLLPLTPPSLTATLCVFGTAVVLNLYVAAILDLYQSSFTQTHLTADWQLSPEQVSRFRALWNDVNGVQGKRKMALGAIPRLLQLLIKSKHPLGDVVLLRNQREKVLTLVRVFSGGQLFDAASSLTHTHTRLLLLRRWCCRVMWTPPPASAGPACVSAALRWTQRAS